MNGNKKQKCVNLTPEEIEAGNKLAAEKGLNFSLYIGQLIRDKAKEAKIFEKIFG